MPKQDHMASYTDEELRAADARGEDRSDWAAAGALTDREIEAAIAEDADEAGMAVDWSKASVVLPRPKAVLNMRIDRDVLDFFRREGRGYQTKINAVLRSYVDQLQQHDK